MNQGNEIPFRARVSRALWLLIDGVIPPRCAGCEQAGIRWCEDCQRETDNLPEYCCDLCGKPGNMDGRCFYCSHERPNYAAARSGGVFENGVRNALHRLKYKGDISLGEALSAHLEKRVRAEAWSLDVVVPVPLGPKRYKTRGYNQAAILAEPLAWRLNLPYLPKSIQRIRETRSQIDLTREERKQNVAGAFQADRNLAAAKNILLVDDVMTTGATLNSAAQALLLAGAEAVYAVTFGRAR